MNHRKLLLFAPCAFNLAETARIWLPDFFEHSAGITDHVHPDAIKAVPDRCILAFINFWIKHGFPEFGKPCREAFRRYRLQLDFRFLAR